MRRFWKKVDITTKCWNWIGHRNHDGYGRFMLDGKVRSAHRVVYELTYGPIPKGVCVCHKCDNPGCVNPAHLFLGSHADNMTDMCKKERLTRKIDGKTAKAIRDAPGTQQGIAYRFGVSPSLVSQIKCGRVWQYV